MSAPLMPTGPPPMAHGRGYFSPPPPSSSRPSYDYRSPPQHPYGRPDMGRRHSYHPFYDYPVYEMGVPLPYHHPAYMAMGPFDGGMGARGPISRTTKACDACRSRKVRCDAGGMPGATGTCSRCRESGRVCVYTATQKKRGPTPGRPSRSQSHNVNDGGRRESPEASASMSSAGQHAPDRRQTWSNSSRPPPTPSGTLRHSMPGYIPHSAGLPPTAPWGYPYGYDERPARPHAHPHSYRSPPAGPRSAPLVERDRPPPSGWGEPQGQGQGPQGGPPGPPLPGPQQQPPLPPAPAHLGAPATQAPPVGPGTPHHPHEPRQPPLFDSNYSLHPHPASAWPHNPPRREYSYAPDFERRSHSPPSVRTLAPLRRD
jgi:hypothetical protein